MTMMMGYLFPFTLLVFVSTVLLTGVQGKCDEGERFDPITKTCIPCVCGAGKERELKPVIPTDKENGAMACPACKPCLNGHYSNQETGFNCLSCSTDCQMERRTTEVPCDKTQDRRCGGCLNGYYETMPTGPCSECTMDTSHRPECQAFSIPKTTSISFQQATTKAGTLASGNKTTTIWDFEKYTKSGVIETILGLVAFCVLGVIICCIVQTVKHCKIRNASGNYSSVSTVPSGDLSSIKIHGGTNNNEVDGTNHVEEEGTNGNEDNIQEEGTNSIQEDGIIDIEENNEKSQLDNLEQQMKKTKLERNDVYLRIVSTKIEKDPKNVFGELNIGENIIYQETQCHKDDVCEQHLQILNRWVSKIGQDANLYVLYKALEKHNFSLACSCIIKSIQEKRDIV